MAIVSLVGHQMKSLVGIAGRMFTALAEASNFFYFYLFLFFFFF